MAPTLYRNVLSAAQHKMSATIDQIRHSVPHAGETGDLVERVVRNQLLEVLPEKVGVSNGFVVDSQGSVSRQMDVILYDRPSTPRIFTSDGAQIFPVESTYACGEVKTDMDSKQLIDSFEKSLSYKNLVRKAYYSEPNGIFQRTYKLFGRDVDHWQSIFFCIAAHSVASSSLMPTFKKLWRSVHSRFISVSTPLSHYGQLTTRTCCSTAPWNPTQIYRRIIQLTSYLTLAAAFVPTARMSLGLFS